MLKDNDKNINFFLHVGMPKTATTSIQETLNNDNNIRLLNNYGYFTGKNGNYIANSLMELYGLNRNDIDNIIIGNIMDCNNLNIKNYILSDEILVLCNESELNLLKERFKKIFNAREIKYTVIVNIRDFVDFINSSYNQRIKTLEVSEIILNDISYYAELYRRYISQFINVFGLDNITFIEFNNTKIHEYGPVGFFLEVIGFPSDKIKEFNIIKSNEAITDLAIEILSYIQDEIYKQCNKNYDLYLNKINSFEFSKIKSISGGDFKLPLKTIYHIFIKCREDLKWLKEVSGIDYTIFGDYNYNCKIIDLTHRQESEFKEIYNAASLELKEILIKYLLYKENELGNGKYLELYKSLII